MRTGGKVEWGTCCGKLVLATPKARFTTKNPDCKQLPQRIAPYLTRRKCGSEGITHLEKNLRRASKKKEGKLEKLSEGWTRRLLGKGKGKGTLAIPLRFFLFF